MNPDRQYEIGLYVMRMYGGSWIKYDRDKEISRAAHEFGENCKRTREAEESPRYSFNGLVVVSK